MKPNTPIPTLGSCSIFLRPAFTCRLGLLPLLGLTALLLGGCASLTGPRPVILDVHLADGGQPTLQQMAAVEQAIAGPLARDGYRRVTLPDDADFRMVVLFTPDPLDPAQGTIERQGVHVVPHAATMGGVSTAGMLSSAQQSQRDMEAWAKSRESTTYP